MKRPILATAPLALFLTSAVGCFSQSVGPDEPLASASGDLTACPTPSADDDQARAAATVALKLMKGAAELGGATWPTWSNTILASQRYRLASSGNGIEFEPGDPLYQYVTDHMKADLAFAQLDASVARYLSDALKLAFETTTGDRFASIRAIGALAGYRYPGPIRAHVPDPSSYNDSHEAVVSGRLWCGTSIVTIDETVQQSWQFAPIYKDSIFFWNNAWLSHAPAAFHGSLTNPSTPFNGPSAAGNPYLVVSVNGTKTNWANYNYFNSTDCWKLPDERCYGSLEIDPVPYAEPGQNYDSNGNLLGMQSNPYQLDITVLYADPDHASQWATRIANGVQQWGTFSAPVTILGYTEYKYVRKY